MIAFARPGMADFKGSERWYAGFFLLAILGLIVPRTVEVKIDRRRRERPGTNTVLKEFSYDIWGDWLWFLIRCVVFGVCLYIAIHIFAPLWPLLWGMFIDGAFLYLGLMCLITSLLCATFLDKRQYSVPEARVFRQILNLCVCLALTCVAIVNFAYRIYSYIPEEKGGGDFTTGATSIISFDDKFSNSLPHFLIDSNLQSKAVMVLNKDDHEILVAIPFTETLTVSNQSRTITNGPFQWRGPGFGNKPRLIFSIKREAVVAVSGTRSTSADHRIIYTERGSVP
jgi:hypothetical protein